MLQNEQFVVLMQCTEATVAAAEMGGGTEEEEGILCATAALMMLNVIVRFDIQLK